jgi:hypothetical protein
MREPQSREIQQLLARYGDDATYLILQDGRVLLFTAADERTIRAVVIEPNGSERDEPAPAALRELRAWVEGHRER